MTQHVDVRRLLTAHPSRSRTADATLAGHTSQAANGTSPTAARSRAASLRDLSEAIALRHAVVGVVGQGYVGFGLAQRAAEVGFTTIGVDIDPRAVQRGLSENEFEKYQATMDPGVLATCDVILVAVPTPTSVDGGVRQADLSLVRVATRMIAEQIARDDRPRLVVSESTYAPGTTRNVVMPIIEEVADAWQIAFGYSPERIDPGNEAFGLSVIPKVTSGADEQAAALTKHFYEQLVEQVVPASTMEAAEATKLLENTFRFVNIAFAQEFDEYCHTLNLSSHEVTRLAATKPFGFMPFLAGAGVGGHCIAEDPYYLFDSMQAVSAPTSILGMAISNQEERAALVAERIIDHLAPGVIEGARLLLMGVTYKPNIGDTRRSPALSVMTLLEQHGAVVDYHDPHVPFFDGRTSVNLAQVGAGTYAVVALMVEHSAFDPDALQRDGWNIFRVAGTAMPALVAGGIR